MNGAYCDDKVINEKIAHAIEVAKTVEFASDSYVYMNKVYDKLAEVMRGNSSFMENLECFSIYKMMEAFLTGLRKYNVEENIPLDEIRPGDILLIKCPSIFASYHFIIAVVNPNKTEVSVFQSYGSYKKLHKIVLSYGEFMSLLEDLKTFNDADADFDATYKMMINVEEKLYGINEREYIARLQEAQPPVNNENLFLNNSNMSPNSYIVRAEKLNIPPDIYENLEQNFKINQSKLAVTAYRVATKDANAEGIKTKKKKSKKSKRKTKKVKRKTKKGKRKTKKGKRKTKRRTSKKSKK